ncbi:MAG TPA: BldC family transcriptional regulator [Propionibacteriaceae bacterium]
MNTQSVEADVLLTPAEVAGILYVDPKTVTRWAIAGKVNSVRTPGGHRRYLKSEILALMAGVNHSQNRTPWRSPGSATSALTSARDAREIIAQGRPDGIVADRQAAAAVVAEAVAIAREAQADEAARAVILTGDAVAAAAVRAADAAEAARAVRTSAAAEAAAVVASNAARTAAAIQLRADASAVQLAEASVRAAAIVAAASPPGTEREAALTALHLAATVKDLAVATAADTAAAAACVAGAVTAAAADVAFRVSAAEIAIEREVAKVAANLQTMATATARRVAADTDARASDVALVAREAAAAARSIDISVESTTPDDRASKAYAHAAPYASAAQR